MLPTPPKIKRYRSARKRFLKPIIENFFQTEFPKFFGPNVRSYVADELIKIFNQNNRDVTSIKPGQVLWNAIHKNTRADSKKLKLIPVVLTIVNDEDILRLEKGVKISEHKQIIVARMLKEAYAQNALLSMRDVSLLMGITNSYASELRKRYEQKYNEDLPHPGTLQDMGSCITHKAQITYKAMIEKKDSVTIAKETNHTIFAVDNYLKDFNRVKTLIIDNKDQDYIHQVTGLSRKLINQYVELISKYEQEINLAI